MYLSCAANNKAETALHYFAKAVDLYGLPDRVRSDKGGENVGIWQYMLYYHAMDQNSVITGSSTHNECIERMWCDVFRCAVQIFQDLL